MLLRKGSHLLEERFVVPVVVEPWSGCGHLTPVSELKIARY
jgi:hypothetical protein